MSEQERIQFFLEPRPPFRLDLTAWVLRRRPDNTWDRWDGQAYRRVMVIAGHAAEVSVTQTGPPDAPRLRVAAVASALPADAAARVTEALERLLGLHVDLTAFYALAQNDPRLSRLAKTYRGVKPPRFLTLFEALLNAIACQQLSLTVGIRLLGRLCAKYGAAFAADDSTAHAFPLPQDLEDAHMEDLHGMGYSRHKATAMLELAHAGAGGGLDLVALGSLDDQTARQELLQLRGIGRWSAEYVLLRGMGRLNVFPGDDVGARNNLQRRLHPAEPLDYEGVERLVRPWQPFAGLLYFHLLLESLSEAGYLAAEPAVSS
jgi:DNA-3-methyladenine glycosylase II